MIFLFYAGNILTAFANTLYCVENIENPIKYGQLRARQKLSFVTEQYCSSSIRVVIVVQKHKIEFETFGEKSANDVTYYSNISSMKSDMQTT